MNVLLLGREGQVGKELTRSLLLLGKLTALGRKELDLTNLAALAAMLQQIKPDVIVNAAAYTAVDKAESNPALAYQINEAVVAILAEYAQKHQVLFIHFSTDYVFSGKKDEAYLEEDRPQPLNVYGTSKLAGEQAILAQNCRGYIFRTSWVFSAHGTNFIKTILNLAQQKDSLSIVADQIGAPTSAELISDLTLIAITAAQKEQLTPGIYHLTATGRISWYQLACYVVERALDAKIPLKVRPDQINAISSDDYPFIAQRPKNSVLATSKLSRNLGIYLPDWRIYVNRMVAQLI